jgi:hypothetical protein
LAVLGVFPPAELPEAVLKAEVVMKEQVLGEPLNIRQVATLIGCSGWSVRQRLIPRGLPHFRSGSSGKLIFYRDQVVGWVLAQQNQQGGRNL